MNIRELERAFAAAEREHTAAAERTRELANKRADMWRQLKAAKEAGEVADETTEQQTTSEVEK